MPIISDLGIAATLHCDRSMNPGQCVVVSTKNAVVRQGFRVSLESLRLAFKRHDPTVRVCLARDAKEFSGKNVDVAAQPPM